MPTQICRIHESVLHKDNIRVLAEHIHDPCMGVEVNWYDKLIQMNSKQFNTESKLTLSQNCNDRYDHVLCTCTMLLKN